MAVEYLSISEDEMKKNKNLTKLQKDSVKFIIKDEKRSLFVNSKLGKIENNHYTDNYNKILSVLNDYLQGTTGDITDEILKEIAYEINKKLIQ